MFPFCAGLTGCEEYQRYKTSKTWHRIGRLDPPVIEWPRLSAVPILPPWFAHGFLILNRGKDSCLNIETV